VKEENHYLEPHNLTYIQSFGDSDVQGFIATSRSITSDLTNFIYVADLTAAKIHQYTLDGDYVGSFGRDGRGPGEFTGNINVHTHEDLVLVHDFSGYTVSFFSNDGLFINMFNLEKRHNAEFQFAGDYLVTGPAYVNPFGTNYQDDDLLYIYDRNGNVIRSFGRMLTFDEEIPPIMQRFFTAVRGDQIHLVFLYFPVYRIYNLEGSLIAEHRLDSLTTTPDLEKNQESAAFRNIPRTGTASVQGGFGGIAIIGDRVFIPFYNSDYLQIDEFALAGNDLSYSDSFFYPLQSKERNVIGYLDFLYVEDRNAFYVLENVEGQGFVVSKYKINMD
jgi:hypothetical protein